MGPGATDTQVRVIVWARRPPSVTPGDIDRVPPYVTDLRDRLRLLYPGRDVRTAFPDGFIVITPESPPAKRELLEFLALDATDRADAADLARELRPRPDVRSAYAESGPQPLPGGGGPQQGPPPQGGPPKLQLYLDAAPTGIDARWVWANKPNGAHVTFVDLEPGWDLTHPELVAKNIGVAWGLASPISAYKSHGAAVLGIVLAANNGVGVTGVAFDAPAKVVAVRNDSTGKIDRAAAITAAVCKMAKGDVLLIEDQVECDCDNTHKAPLEVEAFNFKAIQAAVQAGIVVVEAAGNGQKDLDTCTGPDPDHPFTMAHGPYDTDSGAILVAGATAACPRVVAGGSNHGSRIDCHAWGELIETLNDHLTGSGPYSDIFGGSSGAAAIVAGAALWVQFAAKATGQPHPPPALRALLSDPARNTLSSAYPGDGLGVMPNLRTLIGGGVPAQCADVAQRQSSLVSTPGGSGPGGGTQRTTESPASSPSVTP